MAVAAAQMKRASAKTTDVKRPVHSLEIAGQAGLTVLWGDGESPERSV